MGGKLSATLFVLDVAVCLFGITVAASAQVSVAPNHHVEVSYGKLPLSFEPNRGQSDPRVKFVARGSHYVLFLTENEAVLRLLGPTATSVSSHANVGDSFATSTLRMSLEGAKHDSRITPLHRLPGRINYFRGNDRANWITDLPTYSRVDYEQVYPSVRLAYYGTQGRLEYDFIVSPGGDPSQISVQFDGAAPKLDNNGDLVFSLTTGDVRFAKPAIYQPENAVRKSIAGGYVVLPGNRIGFGIGPYDHNQPLVIDPLLVYSSYLGGSNPDQGNAIAVDGAHSAYITGQTLSPDFPTKNPLEPFHPSSACAGGCNDVFVTKVNPTGSVLVFSTFLGGTREDIGYGIALDPSKNIYVVGKTQSDDFPVVGNPVHTKCGQIVVSGVATATCVQNGTFDAFVTKLNAAGNALVYSGFVGGTGFDWATGIAVDSAGEAYITGQSNSATPTGDPNNPGFPVTASGFQTTLQPGGISSLFLVKLNATGGGPLYGSFLGSASQVSTATGIAIDGTGKAYIVGQTSAMDFPVTPSAFQTTCAPIINNSCSGARGVVAKFDPSKSGAVSLIYSTYLGGHPGTGNDVPQAVAADNAGSAYVAGGANSPNFPTTPGVVQTTCAGGSGTCAAAFLTKLNATGSGLVYSTFIGGQPVSAGMSVNSSKAYGVRVDSAKNAYVTGQVVETIPSVPSFPVVHPIQTVGQVFVSEVNPAGNALLFSTHFGSNGQNIDQPTGIAVDTQGSTYVTGLTFSNLFTVTPNAFQKGFKDGVTDGFVFKIATKAADLVVSNAAPTTVNSGSTLSYSITVTNNGPDTATGVAVSDTVPAGTTFVSVVSTLSCTTPPINGTGTVVCKNITLNNGNSVSLTMTVHVNAPSKTVITDIAKASSPIFDANTVNNSAKALTTVN